MANRCRRAAVVLRALRDLTAYGLAVGSIALLGGVLLRTLVGGGEGRPEWLRMLVTSLVILSSVGVVHAVMRWRGRTKYTGSGWLPGMQNLHGLTVGALAGLAMIAGCYALLFLSGAGRLVSTPGDAGDYLRMLIPVVASFGLLAAAEEILFRGYPLAKLASLTGPLWANVILSVLFAAAHLGNEGTTLLVTVNVFLGSLVAGLIRFSRYGIPAAIGFHAAWNLVQILLGATMSGMASPMPAVRLITRGLELWTGGEFGPEGSLWATLATLVMIGLIMLQAQRSGMRNALPIPATQADSGEGGGVPPSARV